MVWLPTENIIYHAHAHGTMDRKKGKHSLFADKYTRLFYLLIQFVRTANYGRWCRCQLQKGWL